MYIAFYSLIYMFRSTVLFGWQKQNQDLLTKNSIFTVSCSGTVGIRGMSKYYAIKP